jgi:hypothetical protein
MTADAALAAATFRLIDNGERIAIHRVAIDATGALIDFDPEPMRLEAPADLGEVARLRMQSLALEAANATWASAPVLQLRDGRLIEPEPVTDAEPRERLALVA